MRLVPEQVAKEFRRAGVVKAVLSMTQLELRTDRKYALQATKAAQQSLTDRCEVLLGQYHIHDARMRGSALPQPRMSSGSSALTTW